MPNPSLPNAAQAGHAAMTDFAEDYRSTSQVADLPLEHEGYQALVARAQHLVKDRGLVLPDPDLLDRAVAALLTGNLILEGPPGTGKTTLAQILAEAFNVTTKITTATADWSTYDVIGGFQPQGSTDSTVEALAPWLGEVTRAALRCATVAAQHEHLPENQQPHQAHWLIVDEINRGEIDKAFGPLYTALGGSGGDARRIPLWFGLTEETKELWLVDRFRIIGTLNSVDTAYVFTLSQGLQRRFNFVYVGVPSPDQLEAEIDAAATQASAWHSAAYQSDATPENLAVVTGLVRGFVAAVRYLDQAEGGWPVGTAQVTDVLKNAILRLAGVPEDAQAAQRAADMSIADKLVPQMSGLSRRQLDAVQASLASDELAPLVRTKRALERVRSTQHTAFA